jgi:hypothetical protein
LRVPLGFASAISDNPTRGGGGKLASGQVPFLYPKLVTFMRMAEYHPLRILVRGMKLIPALRRPAE